MPNNEFPVQFCSRKFWEGEEIHDPTLRTQHIHHTPLLSFTFPKHLHN